MWTPDFHQLWGSNNWNNPMFKDIKSYTLSLKQFQHTNMTTQKIFISQFRSLPRIVAYDKYFADPQNGDYSSRDEELNSQHTLKKKYSHSKPNGQIKSNDLITDSQVSNALRYPIIDLWTVDTQLLDTSALPNFPPRQQNHQKQTVVMDDLFDSPSFSHYQQTYHWKTNAEYYINQWTSGT